MKHRGLAVLAWVLIITWGAVILAFMLYAAGPWDEFAGKLWLLVLFALWNLSPHALAVVFISASVRSRAKTLTVLIGVVMAWLASVAMLLNAFVFRLDAQSGIILVFLPVYTVPILVLALVIGSLLARRLDGLRQG